MTPIEIVRTALERNNSRIEQDKGHYFMAQCPVHDDGRPSLQVAEGNDGRVLLKCFADCPTQEIVTTLGLEWGDTFPDDGPRKDDWTPEAEYTYLAADGSKLFQVVRFPGKQFRQKRWTGTGWEWGLEGVERVLFRLPDVLAAKGRNDKIFLTEGEKDALAVVGAGRCGTTMAGGAGSWQDNYTASLAGATVIILADDDAPGRKHAEEVFRRLYGKVDGVNVCLPAEGHKDIAAHLAAGLPLTRDALRRHPVMEDVPSNGNGNGRGAFTAAAFAARKTQIDTVLGPLFCRGMRTAIGAQIGEGKSTFVMQAVKSLVTGEPFLDERWTPRRTGRALIVDLEQGEATVQARLEEAGLDTCEAVDILWEPSGISIDKREEDCAMVRDALCSGDYSMVVLDPLYQLHENGDNDGKAAAAVMSIVDGWAREFNVSLVIPMHARKPHPEAGKNFTKHDIAGVGTWLRNAEVVLGLQLMYAGVSRLWFFKDRIGRGPTIQSQWGLDFERETGFRRNYAEEKTKRKKEARAAARLLVDRDEGATREEIIAVLGDEDQVGMKATLKKTHELEGRYRSRPWAAIHPGQEQLSTD